MVEFSEEMIVWNKKKIGEILKGLEESDNR